MARDRETLLPFFFILHLVALSLAVSRVSSSPLHCFIFSSCARLALECFVWTSFDRHHPRI